MPKKIKSLLLYSLFILNILNSLALLISSLASFISPVYTTIPAILGLCFPFLFLANLIFIIIWGIRREKRIYVALVTTILALPVASRFTALNFSKKEPAEPMSKVLSFNVRNFDLYNWSSNKLTRNKIFDFLKEVHADVICLQEFFNNTDRKDDFITLDTIVQLQPAKNHHVEYTSTLFESQKWGIATFSTYPIIRKEKLAFDGDDHNICIFTDLKIGNDTLRVYNMHLASIRFKQSDYQFFDSISTKNNQEQIDGSIHLLEMLRTAFVRRAKQTEIVLASIKSSPYPVLVCGDFNDTPASYTYGKIASELHDAFLASGNGLGQTYIGSFPSFRIDYILHSRNVKSMAYNTHKNILSDHYPVSCYFAINKQD